MNLQTLFLSNTLTNEFLQHGYWEKKNHYKCNDILISGSGTSSDIDRGAMCRLTSPCRDSSAFYVGDAYPLFTFFYLLNVHEEVINEDTTVPQQSL